jgi:hypothetical protein
LLESLLSYKETVKNTDGDETMQRALKLEKQLQMSEAEVRKHIRIVQQMRLHMEEAQARIETLEHTNKKLGLETDSYKAKTKAEFGKRGLQRSKVSEIELKLNSDISTLHRKLETSQIEGEVKKQRKLVDLKQREGLRKS